MYVILNKSNQMEDTNIEQNKFFRHFQKLGILFGGVAPIAVFFLVAYFIGIKGLAISISGFGIILFLTVLVLTVTITLLLSEKSRDKKWFKGTELFQALLCFSLTACIIHHTGGSRNSVFAFSCLYIPSVVGYVYGKKDKSLIGAAIAMSLIYLFNLKWATDCSKMVETDLYKLETSRIGIVGPINIEIIYGLLFILQLYIVWVVASQREDLKTPEPPKNLEITDASTV